MFSDLYPNLVLWYNRVRFDRRKLTNRMADICLSMPTKCCIRRKMPCHVAHSFGELGSCSSVRCKVCATMKNFEPFIGYRFFYVTGIYIVLGLHHQGILAKGLPENNHYFPISLTPLSRNTKIVQSVVLAVLHRDSQNYILLPHLFA